MQPELSDDKGLPKMPRRRASRRVGFKGAATVELPGQAPRDVQLHDLSEDGLSLMTSRPISPGSRCSVTFDVPLGEQRSGRVVAQAKAVYSSYTGTEGFRVGMVYTALDAEARDALEEFLR